MSATAERPLSYDIRGMDCASCAEGIERSVGAVPEVESAAVNFGAAKLRVRLAPGVDPEAADARVLRAVETAGFGATPSGTPRPAPTAPSSLLTRTSSLVLGNRRLRAALVAGALWLLAWTLERLEGGGVLPVVTQVRSLVGLFGLQTPTSSLLPLLAYAAAISLGGWRIARSGWADLARSRTFGIDLLMTVAVLGAAAINQWAEGAAVVFLFSLGEGLEGLTMDRTRRSVRSLLELAPDEATVRALDGSSARVPVAELRPGDVVLVFPGERVPADGAVVDGSSWVNQAPITGESMPVEKREGDDVYAGTLNERGYLEVRVSKRAEDTTLARVIHLIEEAQASKAPSERFVDRFARVYTPLVLAGAVLTAGLPPLLLGQPFLEWFYRALVLLVVSCPCALVISTPVAIVAAIGSASRSGALIKGGAALEEAGRLRVIAFDKTGTLTEGRPEVTDVRTLGGYEPEELVALAAVVEERSEHPLAAAVLRRRRHDQDAPECAEHGGHAHAHGEGHAHLYPHDESEAELRAREVSEFEAMAGLGARARLDGRTVYVGSPRLFEDLGVETGALRETILGWQDEGKTVLVVGSEREAYGAIAVADRERPHARESIKELRRAGVREVVMLTGDNPRTAAAVAARLGVEAYEADLLPEEKLSRVRGLLARHGAVGMVGDGVNDAPALAAASVGVAMGAAGSDTALETADVALLGDDLGRLPDVVRLSRRALGIIKANIAFALGVKAVVIALTLLGVTSLWLVILADTGASLLVIANGMRLLRTEDRSRG